MEKTNVMRLLEQRKVEYTPFEYPPEITEGTAVAQMLGQNASQVFKTLVTVSSGKKNYVFVIPVAESLDLKKAARTVNEKSLSMLKQKELLPLTGYIHGGCSPIGMKKLFRTVIDISARDFEQIFVSAGKVGRQICISPFSLAKIISADFADITV
ncbi:MAG: Cys-tRNA(Pro) deacylase [Acutalibacteraceae bacterium]